MAVDMFPIAFPITQWVSVDAADPLRRQAAGVLGSGRDFVIDRGQPYLKITGKTRPLFPAEINAMAAFKAKLRGSARFCTIWDPKTEYPAAYMPKGLATVISPGVTLADLPRAAIGGAFDGHCSLVAIANSGLAGSIGRDIITLGGPYAMPVGLTLGNFDAIELRQGTNLLASGAIAFTSGWTETNCALSADTSEVAAPDGTSTAAKVARTATGAMALRCQFPAPSPSTWYRAVIWLALGTLTGDVNLTLEDDTPANATTVAVAPQTIGATLEDTGGDGMVDTGGDVIGVVSGAWQRFEFLAYMPAGSASTLQLVVAPQLAPGAAGDSFYAWGPCVTEVDTETISLHRVLDSAPQVADSTGSLTCWVEPEVPSSFTAGLGGALANVYRARAKCRIVSLETPIDAKGRARPGQCTFTAVSVML